MYDKPIDTKTVLSSPRPAVPPAVPSLPAAPTPLLTQVLSALAWNG